MSDTTDALQTLASRIKAEGLRIFEAELTPTVRDAIAWFAAELSVSQLEVGDERTHFVCTCPDCVAKPGISAQQDRKISANPKFATPYGISAQQRDKSIASDESYDSASYTTTQSLREIHRRIAEVAAEVPHREMQAMLVVEAAELGKRLDELEREQAATFHLNSSRSVAVGKERFIRDFTQCPRGAKVQLLNPGGVALYGIYDGDPQWLGWYPVPGSPE